MIGEELFRSVEDSRFFAARTYLVLEEPSVARLETHGDSQSVEDQPDNREDFIARD